MICKEIELFDIESHIDENGEFWIAIAYKYNYKSGNVQLSFERDKFEWIKKQEFSKYRVADKIHRFIKNYDTK
ncbi:MAG: hypothetical protein KAQ64_03265 [Candidatus Pacebacteria bacterium]|nr:hypothetical protein [Candidatus Paceibacterota bacterium]